MKITLDISQLVEQGKLTREEADKLTALAARDTGSFGINILIGFGVIAIAAGAVALVPTPLTAVGLGLAIFAAGWAIVLGRVQQWILLGQICLVIGALMFGGGVIAYGEGSLASMLIVTAAFAPAMIGNHPVLVRFVERVDVVATQRGQFAAKTNKVSRKAQVIPHGGIRWLIESAP